MPSFKTATGGPPASTSRRASTSGQRRLVSGVELLPSVIESPKATIARAFAGASTRISLSRILRVNVESALKSVSPILLPATT